MNTESGEETGVGGRISKQSRMVVLRVGLGRYNEFYEAVVPLLLQDSSLGKYEVSVFSL